MEGRANDLKLALGGRQPTTLYPFQRIIFSLEIFFSLYVIVFGNTEKGRRLGRDMAETQPREELKCFGVDVSTETRPRRGRDTELQR